MPCLRERLGWLVHVFEHIEHQDPVQRSRGMVGSIKKTGMDLPGMWAIRIDQLLVRLDPRHRPKPLQPVKEKPVPATDIKDLAVGRKAFLTGYPFQHLQDQGFPASPPPVSLVEFFVLSCVLVVHGDGSLTIS